MAKKGQLRDKDARNIYPVTKSDLVSRPGGGDVEAALKALEGGRGLRKLFEARGAVYNAETGFYELNGLTDITEKQMVSILAFSGMYGYGGTNVFSRCMGYYEDVRTNLPFVGYGIECSDLLPFGESRFIEALTFQPLLEYKRNGLHSALYFADLNNYVNFIAHCSKLKNIYGGIRVKASFKGAIADRCPLLESINVKINGNSSFIFCKDSPLLGIESFQFLVDNAANTEAVTLTINAETLSKMQDAEGHPEWHALMQQAAEKKISFATE